MDMRSITARLKTARPRSGLASAVSIVLEPGRTGRLLVVWQPAAKGWTLPGGKVEEGELLEDAQARELMEETGLSTTRARCVYHAPTTNPRDPGRHVYVFLAQARGTPREAEPGRTPAWVTPAELLARSPFAAFYGPMFRALGGAPEEP